MATVHETKRFGPRVFISYSFTDEDCARDLAEYLTTLGHQVRREDDRSLMDQKLSVAIRQAIENSEVIVQLLTPASINSEWVDQELRMALDLRAAGREISVLPIVMDGATPSAEVADFWHLIVPSNRLGDCHKQEVHRFALRAVHALPLDPENPFRLSEPEVGNMLDNLVSKDRRVIIDPEGQFLKWAEDTFRYCDTLDADAVAGLVAQEKRYLERLPRLLASAEAVLKCLATHAVTQIADYSNAENRRPLELKVIQAFAEIVLGELVLHAASVAPPAPHPLRTHLHGLISAAEEMVGSGSTYLSPAYYKAIFLEHLVDSSFVGGDPEMVYMEMSGPHARNVKLLVPDLMFGRMKDVYTRTPIPFDPNGEILQGHFLKVLIWQIAVNAYHRFPESAFDDPGVLDTEFGWDLDRYNVMGLS